MLSDLGSRFEMSQLPVLLERVAQLERNTREQARPQEPLGIGHRGPQLHRASVHVDLGGQGDDMALKRLPRHRVDGHGHRLAGPQLG